MVVAEEQRKVFGNVGLGAAFVLGEGMNGGGSFGRCRGNGAGSRWEDDQQALEKGRYTYLSYPESLPMVICEVTEFDLIYPKGFDRGGV